MKKSLSWFSRERQKQKARSGEGGIGIIVKKSIGKSKVIKVSKLYEIMWIEVIREEEKIYLAAVYMSPESSARGIDSSLQFAELETDIIKFSKEGQVIVMGDFNARIGNQESSVIRNGKRVF